MGCDMKGVVQRKKNDIWVEIARKDFDRDYYLFSLLVDDHPRSEGVKGLFPEKGYPIDVLEEDEKIYQQHLEKRNKAIKRGELFGYGSVERPEKIFDDNYHTVSWLNGEELKILHDYLKTQDEKLLVDILDYKFYNLENEAALFSNDFRIIFAFDN